MKTRLSIYFRQKQLFLDNDPLQPVVVDCSGDIAAYIPGTVPRPDWEDMTEHTEGLDKLRLTWSAATPDGSESDQTATNERGSNYQKGLSLDLRFTDDAFTFIEEWLMTYTCQLVNTVEVRIVDNECGKAYRNFEIKLDNVKYSPDDEPCIVKMPLREQDEIIHAFQKTIIEDNWQGWFNRDGTSTKDHPTFGIVIEKKPKFAAAIDAAIVYALGILYAGAGIATGVLGMFGLLMTWDDFKKWVRRMLGVCYFCPSPLIRTYIQNICDKYGFTFDTIFDDVPGNKYRDVCLFYPVTTSLKNFENNFNAPSTKFLWENRTVLPFAKFLNQLKLVFNAEWYVTPNKQLVFKHKSFFDTQAVLYDFTAPGNDKIYFLTYTFNGKKKPAYGNYEYKIDPQDTCSNELKWRYNAIVDFDGPANNPILEGKVNKSFEFASTSFYNDGSAEAGLRDAIKTGRLIAIGAIVLGLIQLFLDSNFITVAIVAAVLVAAYISVNSYINNFLDEPEIDGMVRSASREINTPRLLLWDRNTPMNKAKVVSVVDPAENPVYNTSGNNYYEEHPAHDEAPGFFGTEVTAIYNYPMYVEELFVDNLFDNFHDYDNPLRNTLVNQTWEGEVDLCCEWLDRLGVWENDFAKIGSVLSLENRKGRIIKGRIDSIEPDYDKGTIKLTGTVLK